LLINSKFTIYCRIVQRCRAFFKKEGIGGKFDLTFARAKLQFALLFI
jgi:hypothetical protein